MEENDVYNLIYTFKTSQFSLFWFGLVRIFFWSSSHTNAFQEMGYMSRLIIVILYGIRPIRPSIQFYGVYIINFSYDYFSHESDLDKGH